MGQGIGDLDSGLTINNSKSFDFSEASTKYLSEISYLDEIGGEMLAGHAGQIFQRFVEDISNRTFPYESGLQFEHSFMPT